MARKKTDIRRATEQYGASLNVLAAQQRAQWANYTTAADTTAAIDWTSYQSGTAGPNSAPPPKPATATEWLRGQVAEICELACAA